MTIQRVVWKGALIFPGKSALTLLHSFRGMLTLRAWTAIQP